jgi:hypothetical protein
MRKLLFAAVAAVLTLGAAAGAGAQPGSWAALNPGGPADLDEAVPVNVVFVGYEPAQVPWAEVQAQLPAGSEPVVRSRLWYGKVEKLGISYSYAYNPVYAPAAFENSFFAALSGLATPESATDGLTRTLFQQQYNDQQSNVLDVGTNYFIDAPSVEEWLAGNLGSLGVDPTQDTVVFVNWYGRPDFKFHTYTKFGEPDPDTGNDFGLVRQTRKLIAWGGTPADDEETGFGVDSRVWFHDLSAGPESWTDNWNVDDPDLDGNGVVDYRMPPIWEYTAGGFRSPTALAGDLGKVTRYVGLNLLFTTSPLYPPYANADRLADSVNLDANTVEGWNKVNASEQYRDPDLLLEETRDLLPKTYSLDQTDVAFKGDVKNCYLQWVVNVRCYNDRVTYPPFANLFLNAALNVSTYKDGNADYESVLVSYATDQASKAAGFLGFADDNYIDGTPSGVFSFVDPGIVALGYGLTTTEIHEQGHHTSMSHPHDGYDSDTGVDYGPSDQFYYAWSGDESNSMMSYIDVNWDFSQFDRDNAARHHAAGYYMVTNRIAGDVLASPNAAAGTAELELADAELEQAQDAMAAHDYADTYAHTHAAYGHALAAAEAADVDVNVREPGPFTLLPATKRGGGAAKRPYAFDADARANAKRVGP